MTLADLIDAYRDESRDTATPPLMSDERLTRLANEGQNEACRRASLIVDSTSDFCLLSVSSGDPMAELDPRILNITRARYLPIAYPLYDARTIDMDNEVPGWEDHAGTPTRYITDYQTGFLRMYPKPVADGSVSISVTRLPLSDMASDSDEPEIRKEAHPALVQWMLHRAYAYQDTDLVDMKKSSTALAEFEREFGKKKSLRNEVWQRERNTFSAAPIT